MECQYKSRNGRLLFRVEGGSQKDLFEAIADVQEIFEADEACGMCKSTDIRFRVRRVKDNAYYELRCGSCNARFAFGQSKDMKTLFPKRKDENGKRLPNRGWFKWVPKDEQ
jgi:hypothetical protein